MTDRKHKCKSEHAFYKVILDKEANEWRMEIRFPTHRKATKYIEFPIDFCPFCGIPLSEEAKTKVRKQGRPGIK